MTVVIRNMVRDGWIKRETDPDDRRACIVSLTEKGRKKIIEVLPDHIQNVQKVMSVFSEEEQKQLQSLHEKIKGLPLNSNHSISRVHGQLTCVASYERVF